MTLGWGVQFQQPLFLILLILLLTFFAANMWGLFEINIPPGLADRLSHHHPKMAGDFATGALATLLGHALQRAVSGHRGRLRARVRFDGQHHSAGVYRARLRHGYCPISLLAAVRKRPFICRNRAAWMAWLRAALGVALALTALWLLWVMAAQIMGLYAV